MDDSEDEVIFTLDQVAAWDIHPNTAPTRVADRPVTKVPVTLDKTEPVEVKRVETTKDNALSVEVVSFAESEPDVTSEPIVRNRTAVNKEDFDNNQITQQSPVRTVYVQYPAASANHNPYLLTFSEVSLWDSIVSTIFVGSFVVMFWRGTWVWLDGTLCSKSTDLCRAEMDDMYESALLCAGAALFFSFFFVVLRPVLRKCTISHSYDRELEMEPVSGQNQRCTPSRWDRAIQHVFEFFHTYFMAIASVCAWRAIWYLTDYYLYVEQNDVTNVYEISKNTAWSSHIAGVFGCILMGIFKSNIAPPLVAIPDHDKTDLTEYPSTLLTQYDCIMSRASRVHDSFVFNSSAVHPVNDQFNDEDKDDQAEEKTGESSPTSSPVTPITSLDNNTQQVDGDKQVNGGGDIELGEIDTDNAETLNKDDNMEESVSAFGEEKSKGSQDTTVNSVSQHPLLTEPQDNSFRTSDATDPLANQEFVDDDFEYDQVEYNDYTQENSCFGWLFRTCDWLVTMCFAGFFIVNYWRGTWYLLDIYFGLDEFDEDFERMSWGSYFAGLFICVCLLLSKSMIDKLSATSCMSWYSPLTSKFTWFTSSVQPKKKTDEDSDLDRPERNIHVSPPLFSVYNFFNMIHAYLCAGASVAVWRGVWYLCDYYVFPEDLDYEEQIVYRRSPFLCHVGGVVGLLVLGSFKSVVAPPVGIVRDLSSRYERNTGAPNTNYFASYPITLMQYRLALGAHFLGKLVHDAHSWVGGGVSSDGAFATIGPGNRNYSNKASPKIRRSDLNIEQSTSMGESTEPSPWCDQCQMNYFPYCGKHHNHIRRF